MVLEREPREEIENEGEKERKLQACADFARNRCRVDD
jgi:hypothetical protein